MRRAIHETLVRHDICLLAQLPSSRQTDNVNSQINTAIEALLEVTESFECIPIATHYDAFLAPTTHLSLLHNANHNSS
eukprot:3810984-Amphidinium_carterae.2